MSYAFPKSLNVIGCYGYRNINGNFSKNKIKTSSSKHMEDLVVMLNTLINLYINCVFYCNCARAFVAMATSGNVIYCCYWHVAEVFLYQKYDFFPKWLISIGCQGKVKVLFCIVR